MGSNNPTPSQQPSRFREFLALLILILVVALVFWIFLLYIGQNPLFALLVSAVSGALVWASASDRTKQILGGSFDWLWKKVEGFWQFIWPHRKRVGVVVAIILILGLVVSSTIFITINIFLPRPPTTACPTIPQPDLPVNEFPSLSYGNRAFDLARHGSSKIETASINKPEQGAWKSLRDIASNDPEVLIYTQNQEILAQKQPYFTLILPTAFTSNEQSINNGTDDDHLNGASRDLLKGASIAQSLHNKNQIRKMFFIIANAPTHADLAGVAEQVKRIPCQFHVAGVIGWPYGASIPQTITERIPIISTSPLSDSQQNSALFSVAPSIDDEAQAAVTFAQENLKANQVTVIFQKNDEYSRDAADAFRQKFKGSSTKIDFDSGSNLFLNRVQAELEGRPDLKLLYFAGYPLDAVKLVDFVVDYQMKNPQRQITILGTNTLYQDVHCPSIKVCDPNRYPGNFLNLYYTAFAYMDVRPPGVPPSHFSGELKRLFDRDQSAAPSYLFGRANSYVILAYDAVALFGRAFNKMQQTSMPPLQEMTSILRQIKGSQAIIGVSGQISFAADGRAEQKTVVILNNHAEGRDYLPKLAGSFCGSIPHCQDGTLDAKEVL